MDFTTINNRLHTLPPPQVHTQAPKNFCYQSPIDFWQDLATLFFETTRLHHPGTTKRIYIDTLRELTYQLYRAWVEQLHDIASGEINKKQEKEDELRRQKNELV